MRLDLGRGNNDSRAGEGQSNVGVCRDLLGIVEMTILGLHLARQTRADSTQLGVKGDSSASDVVRLRAAQAAAPPNDAVGSHLDSSNSSGTLSSVSTFQLGSPQFPLALRDHETVVDGLEESTLHLAEILDGQTRDLGPGAVRVSAILHKLGSDHDRGEEHASGAADEAELFLGHTEQGRGGLSLELDLDAGSTSRLLERHLLGLLGSLAESDAVEQSSLQGGARGATATKSLADKHLERKSALALGEITGSRRIGSVPDDVECSAGSIY